MNYNEQLLEVNDLISNAILKSNQKRVSELMDKRAEIVGARQKFVSKGAWTYDDGNLKVRPYDSDINYAPGIRHLKEAISLVNGKAQYRAHKKELNNYNKKLLVHRLKNENFELRKVDASTFVIAFEEKITESTIEQLAMQLMEGMSIAVQKDLEQKSEFKKNITKGFIISEYDSENDLFKVEL